MNTPICDFVNRYMEKEPLRLHMPGHKGAPFLGIECKDITEIDGADSLYDAGGVILESRMNASDIFGCPTWYSTEGSSHCIRSMLYLTFQYALKKGQRPWVLATRNVHKTFLSAIALMDMDVDWIYPEERASYLSCSITACQLRLYFEQIDVKPTALYITSPDYLGNMVDISGIAQVCHEYDVLLLVDNAHGAYLRFLPETLHPMDLGADMCCDSAHKTLPVLTGGAYLHLSQSMAGQMGDIVSDALSLFGSTSPSYLILQSLDMANVYMETLRDKLKVFLPEVQLLKEKIENTGFKQISQEPLKITLSCKDRGYTGYQVAGFLRDYNIYCEFADPDYVTFMVTPENNIHQLEMLIYVLEGLPGGDLICEKLPKIVVAPRGVSVREAMFSMSEEVDVEESIGKILASPSVSCPPAVPIVICGERITDEAAILFKYYNINRVRVIKGARE